MLRHVCVASVAIVAACVVALSLPGVQAQVVTLFGDRLHLTGGPCELSAGSATPESTVTGNICDVFLRDEGSAGTTLYVKESGAASNTGWIDFASASYPFSITNPSVTTGAGILINHSALFTANVDDGTAISLIDIKAHNTETVLGASLLYNIALDTEGDAIDVAAGLSVVNTGRSDNIYLRVAGKSGAAATNQPTGIGIDINRNAASAENSTTFAGFGIQIWDWSTTDIAVPEIPTLLHIRKHLNANTDHIGLQLQGNRRMLELIQPEGGGYTAGARLIEVRSVAGAVKYQMTAAGNERKGNGLAVGWTPLIGGNDAQLLLDTTDILQIRGGDGDGSANGGGIQFISNDTNDQLLILTDKGSNTGSTSDDADGGRLITGDATLAGAMPEGSKIWAIHDVQSDTTAGIAYAFGVKADTASTFGPTAVEGYTYMNNASGLTTVARGLLGTVEMAGAGTMTLARGITGAVTITTAAGTITTATAVHAEAPIRVGGTGTITTSYGFRMDDTALTGVTTAWGVFIDEGGAANHFAGDMKIGETGGDVPDNLLHVERAGDGVVARFQDSNGTCDVNPTSTALICASDARLKINIVPLASTLTALRQLQPVSFTWRASGTSQIGFIAQEVVPIFPHLVHTDPASGLLSLAYGGLTPLLVQSVQELADQVDTLTAQLVALSENAEHGVH